MFNAVKMGFGFALGKALLALAVVGVVLALVVACVAVGWVVGKLSKKGRR